MREGTILPADITGAVVERLKEAFPGEILSGPAIWWSL